ncbi:MAG TPA: hypothetical protein VFG67_05350 [Oleiagrimonas sp.]|nr:hypothetical protein [Oleiagrimonas sp.]
MGTRVSRWHAHAKTKQHACARQYRQFADDVHVVSRVDYVKENAMRSFLLTGHPVLFSSGLGK